jgi:chemotaxis protein methyltransferase CheR
MVEPLAPAAQAAPSRDGALADLELNLLLEAILRFSGHDFSDYAQSTLKRRVAERLRAENVQTISGLQERVLHDPPALARFILAMSSGHTKLFAEPEFFQAFRTLVIPLLRTYSFTRLWVPNCATGEDAYSLAVLLHEEGLLERSMIYATDGSELAIAAARTGRFEFESHDEPSQPHRASGATRALSQVCAIREGSLTFGDELKRHIIFAQHSLVTDGSINEFHVIVARGVLRQFNMALQFRVHNLFLSSLIRLGFLCLGSSETLALTPHEGVFRRFADRVPIYRRMR